MGPDPQLPLTGLANNITEIYREDALTGEVLENSTQRTNN